MSSHLGKVVIGHARKLKNEDNLDYEDNLSNEDSLQNKNKVGLSCGLV